MVSRNGRFIIFVYRKISNDPPYERDVTHNSRGFRIVGRTEVSIFTSGHGHGFCYIFKKNNQYSYGTNKNLARDSGNP